MKKNTSTLCIVLMFAINVSAQTNKIFFTNKIKVYDTNEKYTIQPNSMTCAIVLDNEINLTNTKGELKYNFPYNKINTSQGFRIFVQKEGETYFTFDYNRNKAFLIKGDKVKYEFEMKVEDNLAMVQLKPIEVKEVLHSNVSNIVSTPKFTISTLGFSNTQNTSRPFIVFEFNSLDSSSMKAAVLSELSSMYKSPKDVISNIGDNIISIEGYATRVFKYNSYSCDILFTLTIEFKDGKVRYNAPNIKQMYVDSQIMGMMKLDTTKTFSTIAENGNQSIVADYFNSLITKLNNAINNADSW